MSNGNEPKGRARFPDLTLADLLNELVWPRLMQAGGLAFSPQRLFLAACTLVGVGLIGSLSRLWSGASFGSRAGEVFGGAFRRLGDTIGSIDLMRIWELPLKRLWIAAQAVFLDAPAQLLREFPVSAVALGVPMVMLFLVGWFAIARSAAWEFGVHAPEAWTVSVARGVQRLGSMMLGVFGVPMVCGVLLVVIAGMGWLLMPFPVLDVLAAVFWGLGLILCVVTAFVAALWAAGLLLVPPALACEGPDAFDAIQRSMAYVLGRPLRYVIYVAILVIVGVLLTAVVELVLHAGHELATRSMCLLLASDQAGVVTLSEGDPPLEGTRAAAALVLEFWRSLLALTVASFVVSYVGSASSVLYLSMRKLNDGQDVGDLATEMSRR
ncbi:MAG: hypothetical protein DYG94_13450 [Leptolyngbya sp. PLA3]|nr:MAG: hypothetical protein EDM82_14005 [Cyanobacteria bacterium CYA]MCE7969731.1 hypothetical protein [Leptolyngbya sp. PL-A3]